MLFLYLFTVFVWGTTWFAIKLQLGLAPIAVSIFYRFALSALLLLAYCFIKRYSLRFSLKEHFFLCLLGFSMFSIHYLLIYQASVFLVSGLVSVFFSLASLFNLFNMVLFFKKKPAPHVIAGALLGIVGIVLFFWKEFMSLSLESKTLFGAALAISAALLFSIGNMISHHNQKQGMPLTPSMTIAMSYGAGIMLLYIFSQNISFVVPTDRLYWGTLIYLALFGSVIAFFCYLKLVSKIGPDKAGYATVFFPIVAITLSYFVEGYRLGVWDILGVSCVVIGNCLIGLKKKSLSKIL